MLLYLEDTPAIIDGTDFLRYGQTRIPSPDFTTEPFTTHPRYVSLQHHSFNCGRDEFYSVSAIAFTYWSLRRPEVLGVEPPFSWKRIGYTERETWAEARAAAVEVANSWGGLAIIDFVQLSNE